MVLVSFGNVLSVHTKDQKIRFLTEGELNSISYPCNYRLITAYLLLRVNLDKIMHACWDFDASSARTRRTRLENKSTLRSRKSTLRDAHARVSTARDVRSAIVQR